MCLFICIEPDDIDDVRVHLQGQEIEGPGEGFLCMKAAWPSTIRTIYGDQDRFETTYFAPFKVDPPTTSVFTAFRVYTTSCTGTWLLMWL